MNFAPIFTAASFLRTSSTPFPSSGFVLSSAGSAFALFGVMVGGIIAVAIILALAQQAEINNLRKKGKRITATVQEIQHQTRSSFSGTGATYVQTTHHYYVVVATWTDPETDTRYTASSDELSSHPRCAVGDKITVFVDINDPARYHIEI